jgi:hypothetical protein
MSWSSLAQAGPASSNKPSNNPLKPHLKNLPL